MQSKSIWKSRTFWTNILVLAAGTAGYVAGHDVIQEYPQVVAGLGAAVGLLNIILRLVTTQPVK